MTLPNTSKQPDSFFQKMPWLSLGGFIVTIIALFLSEMGLWGVYLNAFHSILLHYFASWDKMDMSKDNASIKRTLLEFGIATLLSFTLFATSLGFTISSVETGYFFSNFADFILQLPWISWMLFLIASFIEAANLSFRMVGRTLDV